MRIFIMGEVGVGKSHSVDHLETKGYDVVEDPVISLGEEFLSGNDSLKIQLGVASALYVAAAVREDGIFDSCLPQSFQFVRANARLGYMTPDTLGVIRQTYLEMIKALGRNDVYIYLDKPRDVIKGQITKRGRPYEQDNPFIREANDIIHEGLCDFTRALELRTYVVDVSENYDQLEELIDSLQGEN